MTASVPLLLCTWEESNLQPFGPQPNVLSVELQVLYKLKPMFLSSKTRDLKCSPPLISRKFL